MSQKNNADMLVSVICITYNHGKYIADALENFVKQKTNFKFEVLVHDDCSTDETIAIIEKYEKQYPDIVKAYYEEENQHSKGGSPNRLMMSKACGKYIALCEGDDFWCDEDKLQKQIDYMEKHNECALCIHSTDVLDVEIGKIVRRMSMYNDNCIVEPETLLMRRNDFATSSMVFRKVDIDSYPEDFGFFDYMLKSYLATKGNAYYISKPMSVYRTGVMGAWTQRVARNQEKFRMFVQKEIDFYEKFNAFSDFKFDKVIKELIRNREYRLCKVNNDYKKAVSEYPEIVKTEKCIEKVFIYGNAYCLEILKAVQYLYRGIKKLIGTKKEKK